jgi:hypothetical protein
VKCKGCGNHFDKLIKAHIIPKAFFNLLQFNGKSAKQISDKEGEYDRKVPKGVYDCEILCRSCEDAFLELDDYGSKILLKSDESYRPIISEEMDYVRNNIMPIAQ